MLAEIKIRAERKAGQILKSMEKQHGARGVGKKVEFQTVTPLADLGITKMQSSRWQLAVGNTTLRRGQTGGNAGENRQE